MSSAEHSVVHLILGAAGGIGSAVCRRLAAGDATVALAGRRTGWTSLPANSGP
jgi:NAD(P)-dependent dehydrogenase (short-subunit alcohol dehydrogenase family)